MKGLICAQNRAPRLRKDIDRHVGGWAAWLVGGLDHVLPGKQHAACLKYYRVVLSKMG